MPMHTDVVASGCIYEERNYVSNPSSRHVIAIECSNIVQSLILWRVIHRASALAKKISGFKGASQQPRAIRPMPKPCCSVGRVVPRVRFAFSRYTGILIAVACLWGCFPRRKKGPRGRGEHGGNWANDPQAAKLIRGGHSLHGGDYQ